MKKFIAFFAALLLAFTMVAMFAACGEKTEEVANTDTTKTETTEQVKEEPKTEATEKEDAEEKEDAQEDKAEQPATGEFLATIVFETNKGTYEIGLYKDTPIASNNMIDKVKEGKFNGLTFHRIIKDFMVQGGDPQGDGRGGGQMALDPKPAGNANKKGTISMASSSGAPLAHQSDMQFFINTADNLRLDTDYGFVAFGEVISGWETIENIADTPVGQGEEPTPSKPLESVVITKAYVK